MVNDARELNMGDDEHPGEQVVFNGAGSTSEPHNAQDDEEQGDEPNYENLNMDTGEVKEPSLTLNSSNSEQKARYFRCADCDFKTPVTNPWALGRHMHTESHNHGGTIDEDGNQIKPPPPPKYIPGHKPSKRIGATIASPTLKLDTRIFLFYDLTKATYPDYSKTMDDWLFDVVITYYKEHKADFGLENLFK